MVVVACVSVVVCWLWFVAGLLLVCCWFVAGLLLACCWLVAGLLLVCVAGLLPVFLLLVC